MVKDDNFILIFYFHQVFIVDVFKMIKIKKYKEKKNSIGSKF